MKFNIVKLSKFKIGLFSFCVYTPNEKIALKKNNEEL